MAETRDLKLKIGADTRDAEQGLQRVSRQFEDTGKAAGDAARGTKAFTDSADRAGDTYGRLGTQLGVAATALAAFAVKSLEAGNAANLIAASFDTLGQRSGVLANEQLRALQEATGGVVSALELMKAQNQALNLGLTAGQFEDLSGAAVKLGASMGRTATDAIRDLVEGLGRGSREVLDNLGIIVKADDAYRRFAQAHNVLNRELSEGEKKIAFQTEAVNQLREKSAALPEPVESSGRAFAQLSTALQDLGTDTARAVAGSDLLTGAFQNVTRGAEFLGLALRSVFDDTLDTRVEVMTFQLDKMRQALQTVQSGQGSFLQRNVVGPLLGIDEQSLKKDLGALQTEYNRVVDQLAAKRDEAEQKGAARRQELEARLLRDSEAAADASAKKKADAEAKRLAEASARFTADLRNETVKLVDQAQIDDLKVKIADAYKRGNLEAIPALQESQAEAVYRATLDGYLKAHPAVTEEQRTLAAENALIVADEYRKTGARAIEEANREAFQRSVTFFEDLLTSSITGSAQNIEETLTDALKRVAVGFGGQLLATAAASVPGGSALGKIDSAQGLGEALGQLVLGQDGPFGAGGTALTASATALDGSAAALTSAAAALQGSAASKDFIGPPKPAGLDQLGAETLATKAGIAAAVVVATAVTAKAGFDTYKAAEKGGLGEGLKSIVSVEGALAAFASGGLSVPVQIGAAVAGSLFGGDQKKAAEREAREKLLDDLFGGDASFQGVGGRKTLSASDYTAPGGAFGGQAVGLVNGLAQGIAGGDDKLGGDLANMFAAATNDAESFNAVIVNALGLMDRLGVTAVDAKGQVTDLFLDGKITLDEFSADISNLNLLAQEDLVGDDSVSDAFRIMAGNIQTSPRAALKGLELAFKEMAERGVDSTAEVHGYLTANYPELVGLFDDLGRAGIDSFDDIKTAGPDAVAAIFGAFSTYSDGLADLVAQTAGLDRQADSAKAIGDNWKYAAEQKQKYAKIDVGSGAPATAPSASTTAGKTVLVPTSTANNPRAATT